jgi:hypothetical protein
MEHFLDTDSSTPAIQWFSAKYLDPLEAEWKRLRLQKGLLYLRGKLATDQGFQEFRAEGKTFHLLSMCLIRAVWQVFGGLPDEKLGEDPPEGMVLHFAYKAQGEGSRLRPPPDQPLESYRIIV